MRENMGLYRAKQKGNEKWVRGYLYRISEHQNPFIMIKDRHAESYEVDPETVGQYTGKDDKNEVKIFESDIVRAVFRCSGESHTNAITFRCGCFWFGNWNFIELFDRFQYIEVIGNIYDNPELLQAGKRIDKDIANGGLAPATSDGIENFEIMPG